MRTILFLLPMFSCSSSSKLSLTDTSIGIGAVYEDLDGDGYMSDQDCDDHNPNINSDAEEICDGIDNDCDEEIDEDGGTVFYFDGDM